MRRDPNLNGAQFPAPCSVCILRAMPRYLPGLAIGLILLIYWGRVMRLAYKARRQTGRAANFIPTEPLGRALRLIWNPLIVLWIALPFYAAYRPAGPHFFRLQYDDAVLGWIASAMAAAALTATWMCWKRMGKSWRMGIDPGEKTQLIVTGPYAYVRHPIYALSSLLMVATVAGVPSLAMLTVAAAHLLLLQWEARREEKYLAALHGHAYASYVRATGRFLPRSLKPYDTGD